MSGIAPGMLRATVTLDVRRLASLPQPAAAIDAYVALVSEALNEHHPRATIIVRHHMAPLTIRYACDETDGDVTDEIPHINASARVVAAVLLDRMVRGEV